MRIFIICKVPLLLVQFQGVYAPSSVVRSRHTTTLSLVSLKCSPEAWQPGSATEARTVESWQS